MRYPITPDYLEAAPESVVQLYRDLEEFVLSDICRRFKLSGEATESALEQIRILQRQGLDLDEIEQRIRKTLNLSEQEFDEIYQRSVDRNQEYFDYAISKADIVQEVYSSAMMARQVDAIRRQTQSEFVNLTQSLGFALRGADGKVQFLPIAKTYQKILDDAEMQVWSGAVDYNTAIRGAVKRLTDSGLQTVDYASGWHNRVDVAARRAVMTGISQMSAQYSEQMMDALDTRYVETTAHRGARDVDGPKGWENHKKWQGKWYYWSVSGESDPLGQYPDFIKTTGYGDVTGLCGANCRHHFYSVIPGVSEPTYTAEQLANIDPPPFTYQGREYTIYQATQKQRQLETAMRDCKRRMATYKAAGLEEDYISASIRRRRLNEEYKQFSAAAGLRTQPERARVYSESKLTDIDRFAPLKDYEGKFEIQGKFSERQYVIDVGNPEIAGTTKHFLDNLDGKADRIGLNVEAAQDIINNSRLTLYQSDRQTLKFISDSGYAVINVNKKLVTVVPEKLRSKYKKYLEGK